MSRSVGSNILDRALAFMRHDPDAACNSMTKEQEEKEVTCDCGMLEAKKEMISLLSANLEWRTLKATERIATALESLEKNGLTCWKGEI